MCTLFTSNAAFLSRQKVIFNFRTFAKSKFAHGTVTHLKSQNKLQISETNPK